MRAPIYPDTHKYSPSRKKGFAVIIALSLMAFIVLLLISMTTLVRVETQTADTSKQQLIARQNALLGAYVAVGNIQKHLGPDQRVTATGDILANTHSSKQQLTGVWDSDPANSGQIIDWLVSRDPTASFDPATFNQEATPNGAIELVSLKRADQTDPIEAVEAEPIDITGRSGQPSGQYAWWVGDEGVKARINLRDVHRIDADVDGFTQADSMHRFQVAQTTGVRFTDPATSRFDSYSTQEEWLGKIYGIEALEIQFDDDGLEDDYFHSLSGHTRSVLSNTRDGGLKKDLTHLFESDPAFSREFNPSGVPNNWNEQFIFRPAGASDGWQDTALSVVGAPNWGVLRDYYLSYKNVSGGSYTVSTHNNDKQFAHWEDAYTNQPNEFFQSNSPVQPVIAMLQMGVGLEYVRSGQDRNGNVTGDTHYFPRIHMRPIVGLYNPYDVRLNAETYRLIWDVAPGITLEVGSSRQVIKPSDIIPENATFGEKFRWRFEDVDFEPGEIRLFALDSQYHLTTSGVDASMSNDYDPDGSYYVDITRDGGNAFANSLSDAEKDALEYVDTGSSTPPAVEITVDFYKPGLQIGDLTSPRSGGIDFRIERGSSADQRIQLMGNLFAHYGEDPERMPESFTKSFNNLVVDLVADSGGFLITPTISSLRLNLRGSETLIEPFRFLIDGNPRAFTGSIYMDGFGAQDGLSYLGILTGEARDNSFEPEIVDLGRYTLPWGPGNSTGGAGNITLFHIPRNPLLSLGYLQHANLSKHSFESTYMVGNGYAPLRIPLSETRAVSGGGSRRDLRFDFSHEINDRLWDQFYFSTIPSDITEEDIQDYQSGNLYLPNSRYRFYEPSKYGVTTANMLTDGEEAITAQRVSSRLMLEGGFNINSTSVDAWRAFFSSMNNIEIPLYDSSTGDLLSFSTVEDDPFLSRTGAPAARDYWNGYREFSTDEINSFAVAVVDEIKARGPFLSLGDFLNRDPDSADVEAQRRSPLQAALDKSLNTAFDSPSDDDGDRLTEVRGRQAEVVSDYPDAHNDEDHQGMGFPGWVLQSDLLQQLGPVMTNRSDTFRIRAVGSATNGVSGQSSTARVEVIVQRYPEPVIEAGSTGSDAELVAASNTFGRQFRIVQMRWLEEDEI